MDRTTTSSSKVTKPCLNCGHPFEPRTDRPGQKFCSRTCYYVAQKVTTKQLWQDPAYRAKVSAGLKGHSVSAKARAKIGAGHRGKTIPPEQRAVAGERIRERWKDPDYRGRRIKAITGKQHTVATKAKMAEARRVWWERLTPEQRIERTRRGLIAAGTAAAGSSLEVTVAAVLDRLGIPYTTHQPFGPYFPDFKLLDRKAILECDGEYWHNLPHMQAHDARRDGWFTAKGWQVIRLPEQAIRRDALGAVCEALHVTTD